MVEIKGIIGENTEYRVECDYSPAEPTTYWSPGYDEELEPYFPIYLIREDGSEVECHNELLMAKIENQKWDDLESTYPAEDFYDF